ncbi:AKAP7 2'5' RNA ligase-like domain-containing protein [Russula emetica]|nr:AKAP7 2'5' RNA ligase-like domain-containing protein [Russula emetica]
MSSKRHYPARHDSGLPSTNNGGPRRPPKWQRQQQQQQQPTSGDSNNKRSRQRPTHFLALPIGHHPELRNAISSLTSSWLAHEPPIEGLDPSIIVHPRRLHLTLGVMTLTSLPSPNPNPNPTANSNSEQEQQRDLASATALLDSLAPRLRALLAQNPLRVPLDRLAIMQPDPARAHVLYAEPDLRSTDGRRLRAVCELAHGAFKEAGFVADDRPLKLHCTLLNTSHRRTPPGQRRGPGAARRIPFSFAAFPQTPDNGSNDFGIWAVDELQICEMGSWAPDGAYVRVAGCDLRPDT